jgi:hypothetical protein
MADEQNWTVPVLAGLVVLGLAAAHGIDKTQWSQRFRPRATATGTPTPAPTGAAPKNAAAVTVRGTPATPARSAPGAVVPLGVQPGAPAGAVATTVSKVIVQTSVDTCWTTVVDGGVLKGCGPAAVTDTRGAPAAAVTRTAGATGLRVEIVRNGRSAATGTVTATGRTLVLTTR